MLINKRENTGLKHFNDSKAFIQYSNDIEDIYKNIDEYNPNKKRKVLIAFDDMIVEILKICFRKLNISLVFITRSYFAVPKNFRLNLTHFFIMKFPNKLEPQQIAFNQILTFKTL